MQVRDWEGFDMSLSATYLDATNEDTGKQLARRPKTNLYASLDKHWSDGFRLGADLRVGGGAMTTWRTPTILAAMSWWACARLMT